MQLIERKRCLMLVILCLVFGVPTASIADQCSKAPKYNNRSIEHVTFKRNTRGDVVLQAEPGISIRRSEKDGANLSFDLRVFVNDALFGFVSEDIVQESAITCAVTCAGKCPSIFGDGICINCGCDYSDVITIPLPGINDGDTVRLEIVPARGGAQDLFRNDDVLKFVFNATMVQ